MKQIRFECTGVPEQVVQCVEVPEPAVRHPEDVLVKVLAFPIHPADILTLQGVYPRSDPHSKTLGLEAAGEVEAIGEHVHNVAVGDRVMLTSLDNWSAKRCVPCSQVIKISAQPDLLQSAALKINPATAALLMRQFVPLNPGDWIVQSGAGSAVGRSVIQLAKLGGVRTINIVRRAEVIPELKALGANIVLMESDTLARQIAETPARGAIKLALDCIGGSMAEQLTSCLAPQGVFVVYGALSGQPLSLSPVPLIFLDVTIRGFWLTPLMRSMPYEKIAALYEELGSHLSDGRLSTQVDSVYAIEDIAAAIARAGAPARQGKVFVRPN